MYGSDDSRWMRWTMDTTILIGVQALYRVLACLSARLRFFGEVVEI